MKKIYACTWIEKTAMRDHATDGADPSSVVTVMCESVNLTAPTMAELLEKIRRTYFVDVSTVSAEPGRISLSQTETDDGDIPTTTQLREFEAGSLPLFICDYSFAVEVREVRELTADDFATVANADWSAT